MMCSLWAAVLGVGLSFVFFFYYFMSFFFKKKKSIWDFVLSVSWT